nr:MAG TPA: hypothetical protein [Caudoviricetes sp.]
MRAVRGCVEIRASHYKYQDLASHSRGFLYLNFTAHLTRILTRAFQ